MGFLLLQYEYQRANRQCNLLTRTGIRLNDQIARYTKRINKMESVFSKKKSSLESQYTQMSSRFGSVIASQQSIASIEGFNNCLKAIVIGGISLGSLIQVQRTSSQQTQTGSDQTSTTTESKANQQILIDIANAAAQAKSVMSTLISNAQEADTEKLEAQEEAQTAPIAEKEGDLQAEQTTNDALITLWEQRRDSAKEKLPDAIQNSMGHYGLK